MRRGAPPRPRAALRNGLVALPRAVVLGPAPLFASFFDAPRRRRLSDLCRWTRVEGRRVTPAMRAALREAEALVTTWEAPRFGEELVALAPRLRLVAHCGGEVKGRFARPLFERLTIANAPGPMAPYVAELAVTFLLMAARRIDAYRDALRRPSNRVYADLHAHGAAGESLRGRTVGLLGLGRIGRETVRLLQPFGPQLLAHDPFVDTGEARALGVPLVTFGRLLRASEYLVVAAGLTDETRGLLDRRALGRLPDGATVVNVARGGLVDLDALAREVRTGRLRCALDVSDPLEPLPPRHPLRRMRGAILTPHVGAAMVEVRREMADIVLDTVARFFAGRPRAQPRHDGHARSDDLMRLSFSTLGCPSWSLARVLDAAGRLGYDGVELRFLEGDDALWARPELSGSGLAETKRRLADAGLAVPCVDTRSFFHHPDASARRTAIDEAARSAEVAAALGAPGIRVFGDRVQPGADLASTRGWIAESLAALRDRVGGSGVEVWLETHGDFATATRRALAPRAGGRRRPRPRVGPGERVLGVRRGAGGGGREPSARSCATSTSRTCGGRATAGCRGRRSSPAPATSRERASSRGWCARATTAGCRSSGRSAGTRRSRSRRSRCPTSSAGRRTSCARGATPRPRPPASSPPAACASRSTRTGRRWAPRRRRSSRTRSARSSPATGRPA